MALSREPQIYHSSGCQLNHVQSWKNRDLLYCPSLNPWKHLGKPGWDPPVTCPIHMFEEARFGSLDHMAIMNMFGEARFGYFSHLAQWGCTEKQEQETNLTVITEFILLGFQGGRTFRIVFFFLLLVTYFTTLFGNLLIITLVFCSKSLHSPMYFFITQLSMNDILLITDIVPNMLYIQSNDKGAMTFSGCIAQFYFFSASETCECFLLTVMSYDRFLAICKPLRYSSIMNDTLYRKLLAITWIFSFLIILVDTISTSQLYFCKSNIIDHFFCDLAPLLEISCSGRYLLQLEVSILSVPIILIPCMIIIFSYSYIFFTVLHIQSSSGRRKVYSTCSSHLIVVSIFYWSAFSVYVLPIKKDSMTLVKILSLLYTVGTPLINPIIYSLRNRDIKMALYSHIRKLGMSEYTR
ncbi:olfactory receptor 1500-like [Dendrobates tinctorius]|uniref:olfactory receptor 1500-like n=1 Tax=Dendrobates tinctorius TaxID=92724 RepID=UPI003CC9A09C